MVGSDVLVCTGNKLKISCEIQAAGVLVSGNIRKNDIVVGGCRSSW
jgi:hypothetical protein